jgi:hypothetical protein
MTDDDFDPDFDSDDVPEEKPTGLPDAELKVTLTIPRWSRFTSEEFRRLVVEECARQATGDQRASVEAAAKELRKTAREAAVEETRRLALEIAGEEIRRVLEQGVPKTNTYGEKIGEPVPLRELLVKAATDWLAQPVDNSGRPESYLRDGSTSRALWIAKQAAADVVSKDVKAQVDAIVADVKAKVMASAETLLREAVAKIVGIAK